MDNIFLGLIMRWLFGQNNEKRQYFLGPDRGGFVLRLAPCSAEPLLRVDKGSKADAENPPKVAIWEVVIYSFCLQSKSLIMPSNAMLNTLLTVAPVAVVRGKAVT